MSQKVKDSSQAGVSASTVKAWYQNLDTYSGQQETFHWRHMESPLAKRLTQFKCTTCHQGNDPREKALVPESVDGGMPAFTLRKTVNPQMCLMCHGKFPDYKNMYSVEMFRSIDSNPRLYVIKDITKIDNNFCVKIDDACQRVYTGAAVFALSSEYFREKYFKNN